LATKRAQLKSDLRSVVKEIERRVLETDLAKDIAKMKEKYGDLIQKIAPKGIESEEKVNTK